MQQSKVLLAVLLLSGIAACQPRQEQKTSEPALLAVFPTLTLPDTLHLEVSSVDTDEVAPGISISNGLFFTALDTAWLQDIGHVADSSEALVYGKGHFPIADGFDAYWVEIRQHWFKHQSLLVYDKQRRVLTDRITVAEWYGGEGGQILTGSWLFDYNGDEQKDLVLREIEHAMQMLENGEVIESNTERAKLLAWQKDRFVISETADSLELVRRFPIQSPW